jgi:hypothetical protein
MDRVLGFNHVILDDGTEAMLRTESFNEPLTEQGDQFIQAALQPPRYGRRMAKVGDATPE